MTLRTLSFILAEYQSFEFMMAVFANVLENRHKHSVRESSLF